MVERPHLPSQARQLVPRALAVCAAFVRSLFREAQITPDQHDTIDDGTERLCSTCIELDFGQLASHPKATMMYQFPRRRDGKSHVIAMRSCPLCRFFHTIAKAAAGLRDSPSDSRVHEWSSPIIGEYYLEQLWFHPSSPDQPCDGFRVSLVGQGIKYPGSLILPVTNKLSAYSSRPVTPRLKFGIVEDWMQVCGRSHGHSCKASAEERRSRLPPGFAVIDCETRHVVTWSKLKGFKRALFWADSGDCEPFVALSYVWGTSSALETVIAIGDTASDVTLARRLPNVLPLTIEDSISICKKLNCRYLWVDRYCIPQDQHDTKHLQINAMDAIYECASFTIVAAAGSDPDYGLPGISSTLRTTQETITFKRQQVSRGEENEVLLVECPGILPVIESSVWNSRAWTYQEGLLSRRRLVFTDSQVYFQCRNMHCIEMIRTPNEILCFDMTTRKLLPSIAIPELERVFPPGVLGADVYSIGARLDEYIKKGLTVDSDIQNAFEGIASAFLRMEHTYGRVSRTIAGVPIVPISPVSSLDRNCSWQRWGLRDAQVLLFITSPSSFGEAAHWLDIFEFANGLCWGSGTTHVSQQRRVGFPSWSWTGWRMKSFSLSNMVYERPYLSMRRMILSLQKVDVQLQRGEGPWLPWPACQIENRLEAATLRIEAPCADVTCRQSRPGQYKSADQTGITSDLDWQHIMDTAAFALQTEQEYPCPAHQDNLSRPPQSEIATSKMTFHFTIMVFLQSRQLSGVQSQSTPVFPRVYGLVLLNRHRTLSDECMISNARGAGSYQGMMRLGAFSVQRLLLGGLEWEGWELRTVEIE